MRLDAGLEGRRCARANHRKFVQKSVAGLPAHNHRLFRAQILQDYGHWLAKLRTRHAHKLNIRTRRVQQRPHNVEDRSSAALGAQLPGWSDMLKGGVIFWREEECE